MVFALGLRFQRRVLIAILLGTVAFGHSAKALDLFNLTGSHSGNGDVVGPFELARAHAKANAEPVYILVDQRALAILSTMTGLPHLRVGNRIGDLIVVDQNSLSSLNGISAVFESFVQARSHNPVPVELPSQTQAPIFVRTQDLHYGSREQAEPQLGSDFLSEIRFGDVRWFFQPAGVAPDAGGVIPDVEAKIYEQLPTAEHRRRMASTQFPPGSLLQKVLSRTQFANARLGFVYGMGALGQMFDWTQVDPRGDRFKGQLLAYLRGAVRRLNGRPLILLTPNSLEHIHAELVRPGAGQEALSPNEPIVVMDQKDLDLHSELSPAVYLVSVGSLTRSEMVAAMAVSDEPILVEGDGSVSVAIQLGKPFAMFRSPWNYFALDGLKRRLKLLGSKWTEKVYPIPERRPNFLEVEDLLNDVSVFKRLAQAVPTFDHTLGRVLNTVSLARQGASLEDLLASTSDQVLRVSILFDFYRRNQITRSELEKDLARIPESKEIRSTLIRHLKSRNEDCAKEFEIDYREH